MAADSHRFPPRLIEGNDHQAQLIRRALAEPAPGPTEQRSWQRLSARPRRTTPRFLLPALAGALVVAAFATWLPRSRDDLALSPEVIERRASAGRIPAGSPELVASAPAATSPQAPPSAPRALPVPPASGVAAAANEPDTAGCAKLAKSADYAGATACYGQIARGNSMASELALYEKARLEARALGKGTLALSTLDEHRRRFPGGVLTSEVAFTRIDLLMQLGRRDEALAAIDQGLRSELGHERGADLQLMRASLLANGGDCEAALRAAQDARAAGVHPARLEAVERRCGGTKAEAP